MSAQQPHTTRLAVCPIRVRASHGSEMLSQLLFGECVSILRKSTGSWAEVRCLNDNCIGWMDLNQLIPMTASQSMWSYCLDLVDSVFSDNRSTLITLGAELHDFDGMTCKLSGQKYRFSGQAISQEVIQPNHEFIDRLARKLLNTAFLWGGRSPLGIDASGFTQLVFKCSGIQLPRDTKGQSQKGETIDFLMTSKLGDLAFFSTDTEVISHVGLVLDNQEIIHASGQVRIDKIDHYGIYNQDTDQYTHRLKIIKRLF